MYKITRDISPPYLSNIFVNVSDVHSCNLRNSSVNFYVAKPKLEIGRHRLHYRGSVLWKKTPNRSKRTGKLNRLEIDLFKSYYRDNALYQVIK